MATRWMSAFVDPPADITTRIALSKASAVSTSRGRWSSSTISTMRRPLAVASREWFESTAGIEAAPASDSPSASVAIAIVEAVPIVMQVPGERAMPSSTSRQAQSSIVPARSSAQYFQASLPLPRTPPR